MSLYESSISTPNFDKITNASGRPKWINISLVVLTIYTFICLVMSVIDDQKLRTDHKQHILELQSINEPFRYRNPELFAKMNEIVEESEARYQSSQKTDVFGYAVLIVLTIASGIYFFNPISALGLFIGGVWSVSLITRIALNLEMDVEFLWPFDFVQTYGPNMWFHILESFVQIGFAMGTYFYSALKFKPSNQTEEKIK